MTIELLIYRQKKYKQDSPITTGYSQSHCKSSDVLDLLRTHVPEAEMLEERAGDLTFMFSNNKTLPFKACYRTYRFML